MLHRLDIGALPLHTSLHRRRLVCLCLVRPHALSTLFLPLTTFYSYSLETALQGNYLYAGLVYGGECCALWCLPLRLLLYADLVFLPQTGAGNALASTAGKLAGSRCAWSCNDKASETCGGESAIDIYKLN
jgi:hypothetical protein